MDSSQMVIWTPSSSSSLGLLMLPLAPVGACQSGPDRLPGNGSGIFRPCARACESKAEDEAEDYDV